jgi:HAD superfamily hydrolase (TIGR01509 family)
MKQGSTLMTKIKAVIFDMDGVLIDAKDWHYEALNQALELFGYKISRYDHLVTFDGLPTRKKLEMLSMEKGLPKGLHKFINHMKQIYTMEHVYMKCKPLFNHQYALSKLKTEGYGLALASNSVRITIDMMMEKADLQKYLDFTLSNQDVTKSKPDPEIYQTAIKRFNLKPEECLVVEDNPNGVKAALGSGANLLKVETVYDVTYQNIKNRIKEIESAETLVGGAI